MAERSYLSIGEVLALLHDEFPDVTISKIRFLESQGLIDPERTPSGYRKFYDADTERLRYILREQKERFLPLKVIRDRLDTDGENEPVDEVVLVSTDPTVTAVAAGPAVTVPVASLGASAERIPAWMQRVRGERPETMAAASEPGRAPAPSGNGRRRSLAEAGTSVSLTFDELAMASGLTAESLKALEGYGLLAGRSVGPDTYYDETALVVARTAARFLAYGVEPRHLRLFRNAADREVALIEQVILPLVKQRNPQARAQAVASLDELTQLGGSLRQALVREALASYTTGR